MKNLRNSFWLLLLAPFVFFTACSDEDDDCNCTPDSEEIGGTFTGESVSLDYSLPLSDVEFNGYIDIDDQLNLQRWDGTLGEEYIEIDISNIELDDLLLPHTIYTKPFTAFDYTYMEFTYSKDDALYTNSDSDDSTSFTFTITGWANDTLTANFSGSLYGSVSGDPMQVTNGKVKLKINRIL